jgi:hypothetical protein
MKEWERWKEKNVIHNDSISIDHHEQHATSLKPKDILTTRNKRTMYE